MPSEVNKYEAVESWSKARASFAHLATEAVPTGYQASVDVEAYSQPATSKRALIKSGKASKHAVSLVAMVVRGVTLTANDFERLESKDRGEKAWLSDTIIEAYVLSVAPDRTLVMQPQAAASVFSASCSSFNNFDFATVDSIAGAILVDGNHCYYANLTGHNFIYLDPRGSTPTIINNNFQKWLDFAEARGLGESWDLLELDYTKQRKNDVRNCGVYVCAYLKRLVNFTLDLNFPNSVQDLLTLRDEMSAHLKSC